MVKKMIENEPLSLETKVLPNGVVKLLISQGAQQGEFVIENSVAGVLAGMLLQSSRDSFVKAGESRQQVTETPSEGASRIDVLHTKIGIARSQMPDCESLVFEFGKAAVGFPIPRRFLGELAQALASASMKGTTH